MAVFLIPTDSDVAYSTQKARLDGRDYVLRLAYNEREERWHLSILDDQEDPLLQGLKVLTGWPLLRNHRYDDRLPPGEIYAIDLTGLGTPPGFSELGEGRRVELTYFDSTEELPE